MTESHVAFLRAQEEATRAMMALAGVSTPSMPGAEGGIPRRNASPVTLPSAPVVAAPVLAAPVLPAAPVPVPVVHAPVVAAPVRAAAPVMSAPVVAATSAGTDLVALLFEVVAEKTGYPAEMLRPDMGLEADLGIDSIKRVEILSALRERAPGTPEADGETMARLKTLAEVAAFLGARPATTAPAAAAPVAGPTARPAPAVAAQQALPLAETASRADLSALLLAVVAEKTGYPAEMLRLDMSLEADLGIDSIKRVEILSALRDRAPEAPEADAETMGRLRTLGQVAQFLAPSETPGPF
jgi:acyl carrier protein